MKISTILLSSLLSVALVGCGNTEPAPSPTEQAQENAQEATSSDASDSTSKGTDMSAYSDEYVTVTTDDNNNPTITIKEDATFPDELIIIDITEGDGDVVAAGAQVKVNYEGASVKNDGKVFDSSFKRGEPIEFGLQQVIQGWSTGLVGAKVGGRRLLIIPPELGYGSQSPTPAIASNDTLIFVVDMLGVTNR